MSTSDPFREQRGYILLTLMLFVTLLVIAAAAIAPTLAFQIRRDREEEMIHRGVQYSRAVRHYFKKFGRYPTRLEELESTNNLRFLRKRYKDPVTGEDFKLLHLGEVQLTGGAGIAGATPAGGNPVGGLAGSATAGMGNAGLQNTVQGQAGQKPPSDDPNQAGSDTDAGAQKDQAGFANKDKLSGQVFGGGPIVGVVSASKAESIREFNKKKHYNLWQFIYDPGSDRGGLLTTPSQPALQGSGGNAQTGANTAPGSQGQPNQFGQPGTPANQPPPPEPQ